MEIESRISDQLERYLDVVTNQTKLTAQNMANLDTPGYRALGIDFGSEMKRALMDEGVQQGAPPPRVKFVDGLVSRPDGNNVSMDRESLNLAEEQLKYRTGISLLKQQYQMTMNAIRADSGK